MSCVYGGVACAGTCDQSTGFCASPESVIAFGCISSSTIVIGNGPSIGIHYINAQDIADNLVGTDITISSPDRAIIIEDDINLSSSIFGTVDGTLTLGGAFVEIAGHVKFGAGAVSAISHALIRNHVLQAIDSSSFGLHVRRSAPGSGAERPG